MRSWIEEADRLDRRLYRSLARVRTPWLDVAMRRLSGAANYSRLSIVCAAVLALSGPRGRRAAESGLIAAFSTAALVNILIKPFGRRARPDRAGARIPLARHVRMPASGSFPSGHTAAAAAFAAGAGRELPAASLPLGALAAAVGYSRVHTGVHYPGDVLAGAVLGVGVAAATTRLHPRRTEAAAPEDEPAL